MSFLELEGKTFVVFGVANRRSVAYRVARTLEEEGAHVVYSVRSEVRREGSLDSLSLAIEDQLNAPERVARELHVRLGLRAEVEVVPLGSLPRFEGKGRRVVDERSN